MGFLGDGNSSGGFPAHLESATATTGISSLRARSERLVRRSAIPHVMAPHGQASTHVESVYSQAQRPIRRRIWPRDSGRRQLALVSVQVATSRAHLGRASTVNPLTSTQLVPWARHSELEPQTTTRTPT
jgi:hypothetical protein